MELRKTTKRLKLNFVRINLANNLIRSQLLHFLESINSNLISNIERNHMMRIDLKKCVYKPRILSHGKQD